MIVAIDESGSFAANSVERHFFVAAHIRQRKTLYQLKRQQFLAWESTLSKSLKNSKGEIKGSSLSDEQLTDFTQKVACSTYHVGITPYAICPSENSESIVFKHRTILVESIKAVSAIHAEKGKARLARTFEEFANWVQKLSYAQVLKIILLGDCIVAALSNSVGHAISGGYDYELTNIRYMIDRDFIKERRHNKFWHELLRNQLWHSGKDNPVPLLNKWRTEGHPFLTKFRAKGYLDFNELFWKQCSFVNSHETFEVRIADVINTILGRYWNRKQCREAYSLLKQCFMHHGRVTQLRLNDIDLTTWRYEPKNGSFAEDGQINSNES